MKKKQLKLINSITVFFLILSISCQSAPILIVQDDSIFMERETLPPDEKTLNELNEVSELAKSYRQKLISSGIPNFSFNDWQIANTLYERTVREEKTGTIREAQESIARYQLTTAILETLYLSATNENPVGGVHDPYENGFGYETAWYFDDPATASAVPPANSLILSQIQDNSQRAAGSSGEPARQVRTSEQDNQIPTEKDKEPGRGLYIPDVPSRNELRIATMIVSGVDPEDIVIPETVNTAPSSFAPPPTTKQTLTETEQATATKVDLEIMPVSEAAIAIVTQPVATPQQPVATTQQTVAVTQQPVTTTQQPVTTTQQPVTTTQQPVTTTQQPVETTQQPVATTQQTVAVTQQPVTTTQQPVTTTQQPVEATQQPITATQQTNTTLSPVTTETTVFSRYPAQYKVISWALYKDCLWMIAYRVYNDPKKWRLIYEANKHKLRYPDNPDLIYPDQILDIPSLDGEERTGMWDGSMGYTWKKEESAD